MGPDQTTLEEARQVIRDYDVADRLPKSVVDYLMNVGPEGETPKAFPENTYFLINSLPDSCLTAKRISEEMGIPAIILTSYLEGEAKDVGTVFASLAREIQNYGNPIKPPCVLLCSGEATTKILDNSTITGHGGPRPGAYAFLLHFRQKGPRLRVPVHRLRGHRRNHRRWQAA